MPWRASSTLTSCEGQVLDFKPGGQPIENSGLLSMRLEIMRRIFFIDANQDLSRTLAAVIYCNYFAIGISHR
jgi:hypothetical protein